MRRAWLPLVALLLAACDQAPTAVGTTPPASSPPTSALLRASTAPRTASLTRLHQLPVDEGANAIALDASTGTAYVATYAGDTVTAISAGGDVVLGHYVLPEPKEFGTQIDGAALGGSTLFLPRTLVNKLALLDTRTGATRTQLGADDLGVASINGVIAGSPGHVFVFASGPLPKSPPVIAESLILELDERGAVVRRASIPTSSGKPGYGTSSGAVYDHASATLFIGLLAPTAVGGAIGALGPSDQSARELFSTPGQPMFLALDSGRHVLYVGTAISLGGADRTQVEVRELSTNATIRTRVLDRGTGLVAAALDDVGGLLFVTGPLRDREADQVLALDAASLDVLASAEIPWDPYGHGLAVDAQRRHLFVSSRVRPASVTTIAFAAQSSGILGRPSGGGLGAIFDVTPAYPGYTWTRDGHSVKPEELGTSAGPAHCGWQSATFLSIGWPVGTLSTSSAQARQYIRDPRAVVRGSLHDRLDLNAALPPDARSTGYSYDSIQVFLSPTDQDAAIYLVGPSGVERWPRSDPMTLCE